MEQTEKQAKPSAPRRVLAIAANLLFYLAVTAMLVAAVLYAVSGNTQKSVLGYRFYEALTTSMSPQIQQGDLILVNLKPAAEANIGDIITYATDETGEVTVTHRLVDKYQDEAGNELLVTQGDTNTEPDRPFPADRMIGVVTGSIPVVGHVMGQLKETPLLAIPPIIAVITLLIAGRYLLSHKRQTKNPQTEQRRESHAR